MLDGVDQLRACKSCDAGEEFVEPELGTLETNESLLSLQQTLMTNRRQTVVVLIGSSFATFNPIQAYQHGAHAVLHPNEMFLAQQLIEKAVADNDLFMHTFRDALRRLA